MILLYPKASLLFFNQNFFLIDEYKSVGGKSNRESMENVSVSFSAWGSLVWKKQRHTYSLRFGVKDVCRGADVSSLKCQSR